MGVAGYNDPIVPDLLFGPGVDHGVDQDLIAVVFGWGRVLGLLWWRRPLQAPIPSLLVRRRPLMWLLMVAPAPTMMRLPQVSSMLGRVASVMGMALRGPPMVHILEPLI